MANMMKMLKQAQQMQSKVQNLQAELAEREVDFSAGGGMVKAVATCDGNLKRLTIDPSVVDPEDVEMLEDLVLAAAQGAIAKGKERMEAEMGAITKGLNLPGMM
jgi:DNA-binding YbaB/EbfC family protein